MCHEWPSGDCPDNYCGTFLKRGVPAEHYTNILKCMNAKNCSERRRLATKKTKTFLECAKETKIPKTPKECISWKNGEFPNEACFKAMTKDNGTWQEAQKWMPALEKCMHFAD